MSSGKVSTEKGCGESRTSPTGKFSKRFLSSQGGVVTERGTESPFLR